MRKDMHPNLLLCKVSCACGNSFEIKTLKKELSIDICDKCHPFFIGSEKILDTAGRIDKFNRKYSL